MEVNMNYYLQMLCKYCRNNRMVVYVYIQKFLFIWFLLIYSQYLVLVNSWQVNLGSLLTFPFSLYHIPNPTKFKAKKKKKKTNHQNCPTDNGKWLGIAFTCGRWNQHTSIVNLKNHVSSLRLMIDTKGSQ